MTTIAIFTERELEVDYAARRTPDALKLYGQMRDRLAETERLGTEAHARWSYMRVHAPQLAPELFDDFCRLNEMAKGQFSMFRMYHEHLGFQ